MKSLNINDVLYHASYTKIPDIYLDKCASGLDFGRGFYTTSSLKQAYSYMPSAINKAIRKNLVDKNFDIQKGIINIYRVISLPASLKTYYFKDATREWLHYIISNRSKGLFPKVNNKFKEYDLIGGKIADDRTATTLSYYVGGAYGDVGSVTADTTTLRLLLPNRLKDQFCFKTNLSLQCLQFEGSCYYKDVNENKL